MMRSMACLTGVFLFVSAVLVPFVRGQSTACTGRSNGTIVQFACDSYYECQDEEMVHTFCPLDLVFDRHTKSCIEIGTGNTPCGTPGYCPKGFYGWATDTNCETFYYCFGKMATARQYCPVGVFYPDIVRCEDQLPVPETCAPIIPASPEP